MKATDSDRRSSQHDAVQYDLVTPADVPTVADLYLRLFPRRPWRWSGDERTAPAVYQELFELLRLSHGDTFLVARLHGSLIGYLVLLLPGRSWWLALRHPRFLARVTRNTLRGRYGAAPGLLVHALRRLAAWSTGRPAPGNRPGAQVYVLAVEPAHAGRGVGTSLMERARAAAAPHGALWLEVEADNQRAIQFYERLGLHRHATSGGHHVMVWPMEHRDV